MKNKTILLLLNAKSRTNNSSVKSWLKTSGFMTSEVPDVFQAMEEISDFTIRCCPEVVLIEAVSPMNDFYMIQKMMSCSGDDGISVFALSENERVINHKECFEGNFVEIRAKFASIHSKSAQAKSAS